MASRILPKSGVSGRLLPYHRPAEGSHSGRVRSLGKRVYRKVSGVRISSPPPENARTPSGLFLMKNPSQGTDVGEARALVIEFRPVDDFREILERAVQIVETAVQRLVEDQRRARRLAGLQGAGVGHDAEDLVTPALEVEIDPVADFGH